MATIISVVGKKNSGKTTLVERIITTLKSKGYKVGAIKHDAHQFEIDYPGKDSWKMTQAGADNVVIISSGQMGMIKRLDNEISIDEIVQQFLQDVDIVITEGYKRQNKPKIEVTSTGELSCSEDDNLFAIVFNKDRNCKNKMQIDNLNVPCFNIA